MTSFSAISEKPSKCFLRTAEPDLETELAWFRTLMDHHFRAFSFVDRITAFEPGVRISGKYTIPAGIAEFPLSLVAEATGQLAAWSAIDRKSVV